MNQKDLVRRSFHFKSKRCNKFSDDSCILIIPKKNFSLFIIQLTHFWDKYIWEKNNSNIVLKIIILK